MRMPRCSQASMHSSRRRTLPKRDGLMFIQRGSTGSASMSASEWMGASKLSRSSAPDSASRHSPSSAASSITVSGKRSASIR
jgi:hypothetical protein